MITKFGDEFVTKFGDILGGHNIWWSIRLVKIRWSPNLVMNLSPQYEEKLVTKFVTNFGDEFVTKFGDEFGDH